MPQKDTVRRLIDAPLLSDLRTEAPKGDGPAEAGPAYRVQGSWGIPCSMTRGADQALRPAPGLLWL